jgi:hypothetical protein
MITDIIGAASPTLVRAGPAHRQQPYERADLLAAKLHIPLLAA